MRYSWLFEQYETNINPLVFIIVLLIAIVLLCLIHRHDMKKTEDKSLLAIRCKNCIYLRQDYTANYGCSDYKCLLFPWSKKEKPCPVEKQLEMMAESRRLSLAKYETRKKEILESDGIIAGVFYIYKGQIIPDYYSECLMADENNPCRSEMFHQRFYQGYMTMKFTELTTKVSLFSECEKSIPRGRTACPLGMPDKPYLSIDKCYEDNADIIRQIKELYRLQNVENIDINTRGYSCPDCRNKNENSVCF